MPKNPERFKGLLTNLDAKDVPVGYFVEQSNIGNFRPGRLDVRKGLQYLKTAWSLTVSGTADFLSAFGFIAPQARWVVAEKTDGSVKAIRNNGTINDLVTGLNTFQPVCCCEDQYAHMLMVNGIERGYRWDGVSSTMVPLGVDSPEDQKGSDASPTIADLAAPGGTRSTYYFAYRWVDSEGIPSSMSELKAFDTDMSDAGGGTVTWSALEVATQTRVATGGFVELWRSGPNAPLILYRVVREASSTWTFGHTYADTSTDEDLALNDADYIINLFDADGFPEARRFHKPPTNKPYVALYQDVTFYYGRVLYSEGTMAFTNASTTITGTGTALRSEMVGWKLRELDGTTEYEIATVNEGAQTATIDRVYAGTTGSGRTFVISPSTQDEAYLLYPSTAGEPESVNPVQALRVQKHSRLTDLETGLLEFDSTLYIFHEKTSYRFAFSRIAADGSFSPAMLRGLVNNRCAVMTDRDVYCLDQQGVYKLGPSPQDISTPRLQNYFAETVDFTLSNSKWYSGGYNPLTKVAHWFIRHIGDTGTRPKRALCLNVVTQEFWTESYPVEIGGATTIQVSNADRMVVTAENDNAILFGEGLGDLTATALRGTITTPATASTSFVDSAAAFTSALVGTPVAIIEGTGKGTERTIATYTNGTTLAVDTAWTTDTTSVYLIGAINWSLKTGCLEETPAFRGDGTPVEPYESTRQIRIQHIPTTSACSMTLRKYRNRSASAESYQGSLNDPAYLTKMLPDSADTEINMKSDRGGGSETAGFTNIGADSGVNDQGVSNRMVQFELEGYQGLDRVSIPAIDFRGFE